MKQVHTKQPLKRNTVFITTNRCIGLLRLASTSLSLLLSILLLVCFLYTMHHTKSYRYLLLLVDFASHVIIHRFFVDEILVAIQAIKLAASASKTISS